MIGLIGWREKEKEGGRGGGKRAKKEGNEVKGRWVTHEGDV